VTPEHETLLILLRSTPGAIVQLQEAHRLALAGHHAEAQISVAIVADAVAARFCESVPDPLALNRVLARHFLE